MRPTVRSEIKALLRVTPAAAVNVPEGVAVVALFSVRVLPTIEVMTEPAAMPVPVMAWPVTSPALLATVTVVPAPPVAVSATCGTTAAMVVPAARPVPVRPSPTRRPLRLAVARKVCPETPPAVATEAGVRPWKST